MDVRNDVKRALGVISEQSVTKRSKDVITSILPFIQIICLNIEAAGVNWIQDIFIIIIWMQDDT